MSIIPSFKTRKRNISYKSLYSLLFTELFLNSDKAVSEKYLKNLLNQYISYHNNPDLLS